MATRNTPTAAPASPTPAALADDARRAFFRVAALLSLGGALLALLAPGPTLIAPGWMALMFALLGLATGAALALPAQWQVRAMTAFAFLDSAALAATALVFRGGASDAVLATFGVLVCVLCATSGWRFAVLAAAWQVLLLATLHLAGLPLPGFAAEPQWIRFTLHAMNVMAGLATGQLLAGSLGRHMRNAAEREQRFRRLLALAANAYWETDAEHRLTVLADPGAALEQLDPRALGHRPWAMPGLGGEPDALDRLRADIEAHEPLRDVPLRWSGGADAAAPRQVLVSGAPKFDERGQFSGYWGVARDITEVHAAEAALRATEGRYHDLFALSPGPLVLHRAGKVLDANPAALDLLGVDALEDLLGSSFYERFEPGDSRERALARREELRRLPVGSSLPVTSFRLLARGRLLTVRGTGVCVEVGGEPAILTILVDETERLAAEAAVRHSEALLSHMVATTPDVVVVTEFASGRYTMVNPAFERELGWRAEEVVGRTSAEIGVWPSAQDRQAFVQALKEGRRVHNEPMRFITRTGSVLGLSISAARFTLANGEYIVMNGRDVSAGERLRLEREAILANASVGIAVTRERCFVLANRHFEQMLGLQPDELLGRTARAVWPSDEAYLSVGTRFNPALSRGEMVEFETLLARKDGSTLLAQVRARAIDLARPREGGTVWIAEDVTARREAERALHEARSAAEAANRAKSAFLANTSHELRTPLNGIVGLATLAADAGLEPEKRQRHLEQIVDSAQSLAAIISDILDLSKIEAGQLDPERIAFDLGSLLAAIEHTHAPLAAMRGLALRMDLGPCVASAALGDPLRLRQVLANFISNALKFTPTGEIVVRARRWPDATAPEVRFEVQDTGPGIEPAVRERLFQPFTQADQSTTRRHGGTGLGLSISRQLATLMGGEVGVTSALGQGSCFWLELPLPPLPPPPPLLPLPPPPPPAAATTPSAPAHAAPAAPPEPVRAAAGPARNTLAGMRVLMVEDNAVNMIVAVTLLERWGVEVEQATDGAEAVQAVQRALIAQRLPHVVLMDVQMPTLSGHEATQALRALPGLARLPIIALTAAAMVEERERALAAGMNDFLTKPIDATRLHAALLRWRVT